MSTAHKRVSALLDRWLASVELHARYLALDDATYATVQQWPQHQRPTKWVVELARTRLEEMKQQLAARRDQGDELFAESLELMSFLTNLLGSEQIDRFIPLATKKPNTAASGTVRRPRLKSADDKPAPRTAAPPARTHRAPKPAAPARAPAAPPPADKVIATVVADAVRFIGWGREWPALAPLIARLADRPPEAEIAKILRANRELIERQARHSGA
jgi:hypothetical protein